MNKIKFIENKRFKFFNKKHVCKKNLFNDK